ncbi:hypothetical protein [Hymenobacter latericus]|uniref:hypothetical protein n=1 Tax=Hymenobacter sp. YIM 151858-1 TaxID=2987688 RepID=UPI002228006B|nr:hypothetical protein [Hymenobacter sp. YIM 151858-1]UYZ60080.1 hypothetical protein OIS50_04590 [Hymenobacter sp. YIM 151858-1]
MYTYLKPFTLNGRRFAKVVTYGTNEFFGFYKGCQIDLSRKCKNSRWSIDVRHKDGGYLYDGYYDADTLQEALEEAINGSCL